jgi:hypothetical protein
MAKKLSPSAPRESIRRGQYRRFVKSGAWRYNSKYDAYYSAKTRKWVEDRCGDKTCHFCAKRPSSAPLQRAS